MTIATVGRTPDVAATVYHCQVATTRRIHEDGRSTRRRCPECGWTTALRCYTRPTFVELIRTPGGGLLRSRRRRWTPVGWLCAAGHFDPDPAEETTDATPTA